MIIYQGPSLLNDAPIVVIARKGGNKKIGTMLNTWILDQRLPPHEATKTGQDESICGSCRHRHFAGGACYVRVHLEPRTIWEAWKRGAYDEVDSHPELVDVGYDEIVRLGSYGDPAAVPTHIWTSLLLESKRWTGYTHQWRDADPALRALCMASVDTPQERDAARAMGWRTFHVVPFGLQIRPPLGTLGEFPPENPFIEINCPASYESGQKTTCAKCALCQGTTANAKSIWIRAHGPWKEAHTS